ncbi:DUF2306 domain-containing protein [Pseudophaeobacter arcticus]|uniref:DUF2306 domain-containing protein n=1 Tax=Pseudophaeobacter arcticus TaxID=385492 RepID=A0ABQ0AJS0_9RHOB
MTFSPLFSAPWPIQVHACAALALIPLTIALFTLVRGNRLHRVLGWAWVLLMACVALSSFWIQEIQLIGGFSSIHLLSLVTLVSLVVAVSAARGKRRGRHRRVMTWLTYGSLTAAGVFTLLPGRLMHAVVFGL